MCVMNKRNDHSFQLYIFDCGCTVIMYTICCVAAAGGTASYAAACVHAVTSNATAGEAFQPCIFDCSCAVIMYTICCVLCYYAVRLPRSALLSKAGHANHSFPACIFDL
jgi:hypothetical protein